MQNIINYDELESQLYFNFIDDLELRSQLTLIIKELKTSRQETQNEISKWTEISLTKVKEIENGSCKDFNAINNYINYLRNPFYKF